VKRDVGIGPATRNTFIDRLANARLEFGQIAWEIDHDVALLSVYGIELDAKFCSAMIRLGAAVSGHASHTPLSFFVAPKDGAAPVRLLSTMIQRGYALRQSFAKKLCASELFSAACGGQVRRPGGLVPW
jgi:hypothetical protein